MVHAGISHPPTARIELFQRPDFKLGGLQVRPARREVCDGDQCETLEPRVMQVLVALWERRGEVVSRDTLIDTCWNGRVVGDDAINRCIVALRRLSRGTDPPAFQIETIVQVGYCLITAANAVQPRRKNDAASVEPVAGNASRFRLPVWALPIAGLAAVVAIGGLVLRAGQGEPADPPQLQLAAIEADSPAIGTSFRDELMTGFEADDQIILMTADSKARPARPLLAMDATVRQTGDVRQFTVHLRNPESGAAVWSQRFEQPASFRLAERQVAARVVQVLRCGLVGAGPSLAQMTDAQLSKWLRLCGLQTVDQDASHDAKLDAARRMIEAAPEFAGGWAAFAMLAMPVGPGAPQRQHMLADAEKAADRALQLDPDNGYAHLAKALVTADAHQPFEYEKLLLKAIGYRPTEAGAERVAHGDFLLTVGRSRDALWQYRRAYDMQPFGLWAIEGMAEALCFDGRPEEGAKLLAASRELWPDNRILLTAIVRTAFWTRDYDTALAILAMPDGTRFDPAVRAALKVAFEALKSGNADEERRAARLIRDMSEHTTVGSRILPIALAELGAGTEAVAAVSRGHPTVGDSLFSPSFAEARQNPEFASLVQRRRLVDYWQRSGTRPDVCSRPGSPSFCSSLSKSSRNAAKRQ